MAELALAIGDLLLGILQFGMRILELLLRVALLGGEFIILFVQLALRIVDLLLRLLHQAAIAQIGALLAFALDHRLEIIQAGVVFI